MQVNAEDQTHAANPGGSNNPPPQRCRLTLGLGSPGLLEAAGLSEAAGPPGAAGLPGTAGLSEAAG